MAHTTKRGAEDRSRVVLDDPHDVDYWSAKLRVTAIELREGVKAVGDRAQDLRRYVSELRKRR
jgi:hypothetical protein